MDRIFSPDNLFFRTLARGVDIVGLSLLWVLLCIPVVTIGPATAALYHAIARVFRFHEEAGAFGLFFRSLRTNLKQGALATLILLPFAALLCGLYWVYGAALDAELAGATVAYVFFLILLIIPIGLVCWLFPLLGRFQFSLPDLFVTAFRLIVAHIPTTLVMVVLSVLLVSLSAWLYPLMLFAPGLWAVCASHLLERAFAKHMEPQPEDGPDGSED